MNETLLLLQRLYELDQERDAIWDARRALDAEVKACREQVEQAERELQALSRSQAPLRQQSQALQHELDKLAARRSRLRGQLDRGEIADFLAAERQLQSLDELALAQEDQWLQLEEEIEALDRKGQSLGERRRTWEGRLAEAERRLAEEGPRRQAELDARNQERLARKAGLPEAELRDYEALRRQHRDALAQLEQGACTACRLVHPPQFVLETRRGSRVQRCRGCGRYLAGVREPDTADPVSSDA